MTHDYVRNGTTSLFAAFDPASGSLIAQPYRRHRHQEFLRFLKLIDSAVPDDLDLHRSWTTTLRKSRQMQRPGANLAGITEPGRQHAGTADIHLTWRRQHPPGPPAR